jgi:acyl-CoA thioesterase YciA
MNLSISIFAMPTNINSQGDIFGGWLLSQMDLAGLIECKKYQSSRFVTIAIDKMKFLKHVSVGNLIKIYTKVEKKGNTSITILIKAHVDRLNGEPEVEVTTGLFTYVKIDNSRLPVKL